MLAVLTDQPASNLALNANWRSLGQTQASVESFLCRGLCWSLPPPAPEDEAENDMEVDVPPTGLVAALRETLVLPRLLPKVDPDEPEAFCVV